MNLDNIEAISPIDGRYRKQTQELSDLFSEKALISYRIKTEAEYLIALNGLREVKMRSFSSDEIDALRILSIISVDQAQLVKKIETKGISAEEGNGRAIKATNHDVKAVEYGIKHWLKGTTLEDVLEYVHFGLTSEDVNNISYAMMLSKATQGVMVPNMDKIISELDRLALQHKSLPMLARTHGQPASPTTFGKEFAVYRNRLINQVSQINNYEISAKLNGATGNYNAHNAAYHLEPSKWEDMVNLMFARLKAEDKDIKLVQNLSTTQIEPHDTYAELFDMFRRTNVILIDFCQDMWRYISDDWIKQKPVEGEVGSSAMPHKVNPIDFENAEGNLGMANAMFNYFSNKLPISRLQRDLSDSTVERNFGVAYAHSLVAYKSIMKGLSKVAVNDVKVRDALNEHPEVISEGIQTILRREGMAMPYEKLKDLTRGKKVTMEDLSTFIDLLEVTEDVKKELHQLTPESYIGIADKLV